MTNDAARLGEAHALTRLLFRVVDRVQQDFSDVVAAAGLTPPLARMVLVLETPQSMRALADHLGCDASNVTGLTDRLASRGLVERVAGQDRRVRLVALTDEGRSVRAQLATQVAAGSTVMRRLDASQRSALRPLLEAILTSE